METATSFDDLNCEAFLAELKTGSVRAFEHLVDCLLEPLFKFLAYRMNIAEPVAEELAIDTLMTVNQKLHTFAVQGNAKLTTWIFTIAKNKAVDQHRSRHADFCQLNEATVRSLIDLQRDEVPASNPLLSWLERELAELSEQDQQILKWRTLDFSFGQIARWLSISEGNARVRHKRALDKLKDAANSKVSRGVSQP